MSGYCYPEIDPAFLPFDQFPGIVTLELKIVKFPGNRMISGYYYPEIAMKKT